MASRNPAEFLKLGDQMGRIAPGQRADLALVDDELNCAAKHGSERSRSVSESCACLARISVKAAAANTRPLATTTGIAPISAP